MNRHCEEEVTELKRTHFKESEHEAVQNSPDWENIPYPVAVQVFSRLRNRDRINMAQVCRRWHRIFKDPSLWRKKKLVFNGKLDQRHCLFTSLFGQYIKTVNLEIWYEPGNNCEIIAESFERVLENLKAARLNRLEMNDPYLERVDMFPELKKIIIRCIKEMFQFQTGLKTVLFKSSFFDLSPGIEIMDNMATYTGNGLERLYLYDYFSEDLPVYDQDIFKETLTKFTNLRHISVHYNYISDDVLHHWADSLHLKLESMEIHACVAEPHRKYSHVITDETWRKLSASCPKLKVKFCILLPSVNQILPLLQPSVPLSYFQMLVDDNDSQLSVTLKHVAHCYGDRLEHLDLSCFQMKNRINNDVAYLIQRCRYKLKSFTFAGNFGRIVPNTILDLLNDSQSVLNMADIALFKKRDPEMEKKLKLIDALLPKKKFYALKDIYEDFRDIDDIMM